MQGTHGMKKRLRCAKGVGSGEGGCVPFPTGEILKC